MRASSQMSGLRQFSDGNIASLAGDSGRAKRDRKGGRDGSDSIVRQVVPVVQVDSAAGLPATSLSAGRLVGRQCNRRRRGGSGILEI
jgi:hypothetical protein